MKNNAQVHIYLTQRTIEIVLQKAEDIGLTVSQYVKYLVMKDIESELRQIKALEAKESRHIRVLK